MNDEEPNASAEDEDEDDVDPLRDLYDEMDDAEATKAQREKTTHAEVGEETADAEETTADDASADGFAGLIPEGFGAEIGSAAGEMRDRNPVTAKHIYLGLLGLVALAVPVGIVYLSVLLAGPLNTVAYLLLFLLAFGALPGTIMLMGKAAPLATALGKGYFVLGQFAAGESYLIQDGEEYHMAVADDDRYWYDGRWWYIEDGLENRTILGWRSFGLVHHKTESSLAEERVDAEAVADGGAHAVERGGVPEAPPPTTGKTHECPSCETTYDDPDVLHCTQCGEVVVASDDGDASNWIIDIKRMYRTGLQRIGNQDLMSTAKEQTMRDELGGSMADQWSLMIGSVAGLVIGVATGLVYFWVFGPM